MYILSPQSHLNIYVSQNYTAIAALEVATISIKQKKENTYIYPSAFICSASERIFKLLAREARRLFDSLHDELVSTCLLFFHSWKQFLAHSRSTSQKNGFFLVMNEGLVQNNSSKLVNMLDIKLIYIVHVPIRVIQALHVSPSWLTSIIVSW